MFRDILAKSYHLFFGGGGILCQRQFLCQTFRIRPTCTFFPLLVLILTKILLLKPFFFKIESRRWRREQRGFLLYIGYPRFCCDQEEEEVLSVLLKSSQWEKEILNFSTILQASEYCCHCCVYTNDYMTKNTNGGGGGCL